MKLVYQRSEYDCFIAAAAMAANLGYSQTEPYFRDLVERQQKPGIIAIRCFFDGLGMPTVWRTKALGAPFAPAHIASVLWECPHFVAMDERGRVYDPYPLYDGYPGGHSRLSHPDFTEVFWVLGVWPAMPVHSFTSLEPRRKPEE